MKVYGLTEIARALGVPPGHVSKWRERNKLPVPDAELSVGPVWLAETIEPFIQQGVVTAKRSGPGLIDYSVTLRVTPGPYPALRSQDRERFVAEIHRLESRRMMRPDISWDDEGAVVTIGCIARDTDEATNVAKTIIMRRAQAGARIGVREIEIVDVQVLGER